MVPLFFSSSVQLDPCPCLQLSLGNQNNTLNTVKLPQKQAVWVQLKAWGSYLVTSHHQNCLIFIIYFKIFYSVSFIFCYTCFTLIQFTSFASVSKTLFLSLPSFKFYGLIGAGYRYELSQQHDPNFVYQLSFDLCANCYIDFAFYFRIQYVEVNKDAFKY